MMSSLIPSKDVWRSFTFLAWYKTI